MTGEKLAMLRKSAGLSQADLATMISTHPKTIANWEGRKSEEIKTKEGRESIIEMAALTMRQMAAVREANFADPDQTMPAPYAMEPIQKGDLLLLSDREAVAGDLLVCFTVDGKPEGLGKVYPTEGGGLVQMDQAGIVCEIPERAGYRVIAYHVRSAGAAKIGGR